MRATKNALMAGRDVVPNVPDLFGGMALGHIRQTWRKAERVSLRYSSFARREEKKWEAEESVLPSGILAGIAAALLIPTIQPASVSTRNLDLFGAMLAAIAVGSLSLAVVGHEQSTTLQIMAYYVLAILAAAWLVRRILFH